MTRSMLMLALVVGLLATPVPAGAHASCRQITATGQGQDLGGGRTEARIRGDRWLHGSSTASFVIRQVVGSVASFDGVLLFDLRKGAIALSVVGTFDLATGEFMASSTAVTGFGRFRGVEGMLVLSGVQDLASGAFTETITGELCVEH